MKIFSFTILLATVICNLFGQGNVFLSTEIDANYYYYVVGETRQNNFNYGFSVIVSASINKIKVSSGINYSTKNYYYQTDPYLHLDSLQKHTYSLEYMNFPVSFNYCVLLKKSLKLNVLTGFIINRIMSYNIESIYLNKDPIHENGMNQNQKLGLTISFGLPLSTSLSKHIAINISPFFNFKLVPDHYNDRPNYRDLPDDKYSCGLKVGIEYYFKSMEQRKDKVKNQSLW